MSNLTVNLTGHVAELAQRYDGKSRVNAIAPGFFITDQNRVLPMNKDGTPTARGRAGAGSNPDGPFSP